MSLLLSKVPSLRARPFLSFSFSFRLILIFGELSAKFSLRNKAEFIVLTAAHLESNLLPRGAHGEHPTGESSEGHAPAAGLRFFTGFVQTRFGFYFDSGGDVQSRLQSNLSADVQSRHYDELVHDTATSSDVTPAGQGCALG